ncbi:MAG: peptidylprolyl isomerase [Gemmatimonadota bacterium]|nr:peptidylprolyl isomerase [Gemmatimonadota bacterium]
MRFLREPLVHFLLIGAALFAIGALRGETSSVEPVRRIVVDSGQIVSLIEGWRRTWQRPPTESELRGLVDDFLQEEIYYREAIALGLDRDDVIIRRRLRQKVEMLSSDISQVIDPTDDDLRAFLDQNAEDYRRETLYTLAHRYFNADRRGESAYSDAEAATSRLEGFDGGDAVSPVGDRLPLPQAFERATGQDVATAFGSEFADGVAGLEIGAWQGPIRSGFGFHVVYVAERVDGQIPSLDEIRFEVERDWRFARERQMEEELFAGLRDQYLISVQLPEALKGVEGLADLGAGR